MLQAGPAACWLWVCGLAYCQRMATDGFVPIEALPTLGVGNWKKCAGFLVTAGLWHKEDGGYRVHDYLSWNATKDERAERVIAHRDRTARWRERQRAASPPPPCDASVTRHAESSVTPLLSSPLRSSPLHSRKEKELLQPRPYDRSHAGHVLGFCEFKCLSEEKITEFAKDLPRGLEDPGNFDRVLLWAETLKNAWGDKPKLELKWYEFWEARWKERAGTSSPKTEKTKAVLQRFVERHS
jgi:hypothetical protein